MTLKATRLIPLFNRPKKLRAILEYLAKQTYPADRFEAVLADDSGPENYYRQKEVIEQTKTGFRLKIDRIIKRFTRIFSRT